MLVFEALADSSRVQIVEMLSRADLSAGEIAARFSMTRPAVSKHLKVLREAGLVSVTPDANRRVYRLDPDPLIELVKWVDQQYQEWERRLDALGAHLAHKAEAGAKGGKGR